jgi:hypothetical protein
MSMRGVSTGFLKRTFSAVLAAAALVSALGVGFGSLFPEGWRVQGIVLALAYVVWTFLVAGAVVVSVMRGISGKAKFPMYLASFGALAVLLGLSSLWFAQQLHSNETLTWNVDYRLHLMYTNSIISTGGLDSILLLDGEASIYHAGPAWLVAALNTTLGFDVNFSSFFLIPFVSYLSLIAGTVSLGRYLSVNSSSVMLGSVFASLTPFLITSSLPSSIVLNDFSSFLSFNADIWQFGPGMMINTQLGLGAFGIGLWAVSEKKFSARYVMGSLIFASVFLIKPQIALAAVAILLALMVSGFAASRSSSLRGNTAVRGFVIVSVVSGLFFLIRPSSFSGGTVELVIRPTPGFGNFAAFGPVSLLVLLSCLVLLIQFYKRSSRSGVERSESAVVFVGALAGIILFSLLGTVFVRVFLVGESTTSRDLTPDVLQGFWYLVWLCMAFLVALLLDRRPQKFDTTLIVLAMGGFMTFYLLRVVSDLFNPADGYEAHDASEVLAVLEAVSHEEARVLTTDFSEPAEDFRRSGDANYLTLSGVPLFLGGLTGPDVANSIEARRRADLQSAFLETDWQPWHEIFLEEEEITHILISQRCVPKWGEVIPESLVEISRSDNWSLFEVLGEEFSDSLQHRSALSLDSRQEIIPAYGLTACTG